MKLELGGSLRPSDNMRAVIEATFKTVTRELGINHLHDTVTVRIIPKLEGADGQVDISKYPYQIEVGKCPPHQMIATLAHELTHIKDIALGNFVVDHENRRLFYKGKFISGKKQKRSSDFGMDFIAMPYEREAYGKMFPLSEKVLDELPPDLFKYVDKFVPDVREFYKEAQQKLAKKTARVRRIAALFGFDLDKSID